MKKIFVTAGNTRVPIDQVRAITNIFQGKTGHDIARYLAKQGAEVTLATSNNEVVRADNIRVLPYSTFDELASVMASEIRNGGYDAVIHSAAVSDYKVSGLFVKDDMDNLIPLDNTRKVSSAHQKMYFELVPTEKLIDKIKADWGFQGTLVKFKLEVGTTHDELISIAKSSMKASKADLIVANDLSWYRKHALIISADGNVVSVQRPEMPNEIWKKINENKKEKP